MKSSLLLLLFIFTSWNMNAQTGMKYIAVSTLNEVVHVDGLANEKFWSKATLENLTINITSPGEPTGSDYSVSFKAAYDYTNFYCIAFVADDKLETWSEPEIFLWQFDCIELFFNPYSDPSVQRLEECHFPAGINNREYPPVFSGQLFQNSGEPDYFDDYKYYTSKTKNGYVIEMQLPWDILMDRSLPEAPTIAPGTQIPWDINGCDADDPITKRDLITGWSADWNLDWVDNSRYGILELGDDQVNGTKETDQEEVRVTPISGRTFQLSLSRPIKSSEFIQIYDLSGKLVLQQALKNGINTVNLSNQHPGIYIVSATLENNSYRQKITLK